MAVAAEAGTSSATSRMHSTTPGKMIEQLLDKTLNIKGHERLVRKSI
jgi:hypothetical protein